MLTTRVPVDWRLHEYAQFFLRGTGLNNHNASVFKIDDNVILDHAFYIGLYLAVIDRRDLSLVESGFYNTSTIPEDTEGTPYTYHDGFRTIEDFVTAKEMAQRIRAYDYNYFIVVLSQYSWEVQFSKELGEALLHCGAFNVAEMTGLFSPRYGNKTTFEDVYNTSRFTRTNEHHPYAFVGIPGLSPGMGYERLRANQGFYLHTSNYPFADLLVRLRYNSLTSMYTFEDTARQYVSQYHYTDAFDTVFNNVDLSLRTQIPFIMAADDKAYFNYRTNIYLEALDTVYFSNTTVKMNTESEVIYLPEGQAFYR